MPNRPVRQARISRITQEERNQRDLGDDTPQNAPQRQARARHEKYPNLIKNAPGERIEGSGRVKGKPNKVQRIVKEALLDSLEMSGFDGKGKDGPAGYFHWLSRAEPVAYAALISRVIPQQLQATIGVEHSGEVQHRMTAAELEAKLKERNLPIPKIIDHDPGEFLDVESGGTRDEADDED